MDKNESEPIELNIENSQNKFLIFHIHKKIAILIFVGLFILTLGVGAYYTKRNSTVRPSQMNIVTPASQILPTASNQNNRPLISTTPTVITNKCLNDNQCKAPCEKCDNGVCTFLMGCHPLISSEVTNGSLECRTNADCGGEYICPNDTYSNCFWTSECIDNFCKDNSLDSRRINAFPACQNNNDCLPRNGCFLYQCINNECRKINMCTEE